MNRSNFKTISATFEKRWGSPLISFDYYIGVKVSGTYVSFTDENIFIPAAHGDTLAEAIESLHKTIYDRLWDLCDVAR